MKITYRLCLPFGKKRRNNKELLKTDIKITDNSSKEDVRKYQQFRYLQRAEDQIRYDLRKDENEERQLPQ